MSKSSIEWTGRTWNPTTGCTKVSAGCKNCYAAVMSRRLQAMGQAKYSDGFKVKTHENELLAPYSWKSPQIVFVNSMSDLFHPEVPESFIRKVFDVMNDKSQHTYQILTKRPERAFKLAKSLKWTSNIWMGTSIEDDRVADRLNFLVKIPAKVRFLSCEPLIGPLHKLPLQGIDWLIAGGESGHGARPVMEEWLIDLKKQCKSKDIPFFFKQWGKQKFNPNQDDPTLLKSNVNYAKGGCQLKGRIYHELPIR